MGHPCGQTEKSRLLVNSAQNRQQEFNAFVINVKYYILSVIKYQQVACRACCWMCPWGTIFMMVIAMRFVGIARS
jgi:hypothetical protein